ncbi:hypothetical protein AB3X91_11895 [Paraburkholderia sp. BR14263]|uniref:hypothetical protein n=1 Tax=unclassified Paraburkholderia TaxID=2615204 RepID=UPI0034CD0C45
MRLEDFMRKRGLTQTQLGALLEPPVTQGLVSQWIQGKVRVMLDQALQIDHLSGGLVTPRECAEMYDAKRPIKSKGDPHVPAPADTEQAPQPRKEVA